VSLLYSKTMMKTRMHCKELQSMQPDGLNAFSHLVLCESISKLTLTRTQCVRVLKTSFPRHPTFSNLISAKTSPCIDGNLQLGPRNSGAVRICASRSRPPPRGRLVTVTVLRVTVTVTVTQAGSPACESDSETVTVTVTPGPLRLAGLGVRVVLFMSRQTAVPQ
jgi:hypothetical protein